MKIKAFEQGSLAAKVGLKIGDNLIIINENPIRDPIDFQFHASDELLDIEVLRNGRTLFFEIEKHYNESLGIIFEDIKYRCCGNKCIFCFVDQNPPNLRKGLYFKDEDFRLSFLYGNYVTLSNVSRSDLKRIVEQRLSPLYVSIHSTNSEIRKLMLGLKKDDRLFEKIRYLTKNNIELHAQIVLCPMINDRNILAQTINDLAEFYPNLKSIAIVPVGLTRHRKNLYLLKPVTPDDAKMIIFEAESFAQNFKQKWDDYFVYLADEFYLMAGSNLPSIERYGDFPQIENGVGMARDFIDQFEEQSKQFLHKIKSKRSLTLVSGVLASPIIKNRVLPQLNKIENLKVSLHTVENNFYGKSVTVTGLLTGQDIFQQLLQQSLGEFIVLPSNCLNFEGIFLDDWTPEILQNKLNCPIKIVDNDFVKLINELSF